MGLGWSYGVGPMEWPYGAGPSTLWVGPWVGAPHHPLPPGSQNPLGARVREEQRVPLGMVLSDQMVLPDIAL